MRTIVYARCKNRNSCYSASKSGVPLRLVSHLSNRGRDRIHCRIGVKNCTPLMNCCQAKKTCYGGVCQGGAPSFFEAWNLLGYGSSLLRDRDWAMGCHASADDRGWEQWGRQPQKVSSGNGLCDWLAGNGRGSSRGGKSSGEREGGGCMKKRLRRSRFTNLLLEAVENGRVVDRISIPDPRILHCKAYKSWFPNRTIYPVSRATSLAKDSRRSE